MAGKRFVERSASVAAIFEDYSANDVDGCINNWLTNSLPRPHAKLGARRSLAAFGDLQGAVDSLTSTVQLRSQKQRAQSPSASTKSTSSLSSSGSNSSAAADDAEDTLASLCEPKSQYSSEEKITAMYEELETARAQLTVAGTCGSALLEDNRQLKDQNETLLREKQQLQQDLDNESKRYLINLKQARENMENSVQQMEAELADSQSTILCLREEVKLARDELARRDGQIGEMNEKVEELESELNTETTPAINGNSPVKRNRMRTVKRRSFRFHGAKRSASNNSEKSETASTQTKASDSCDIGIQTDNVEVTDCKESQCPHVARLKEKQAVLTDDLREELKQTNDYAMRRRKQVRDLQDELSECRKRLQEYINENTDLREELEDRVSQLQLAVGSSYDNPATPGMSLLNEMNGFRYPVSVVKAIPSHSPLSHALSAVSEADSTTENGMNTRSPGDGACLPSFNNMESIRESTKELSQLRDDIQMAINTLNSSLTDSCEELPENEDSKLAFDPKQPLKTTVSLPSHLSFAKNPSLLLHLATNPPQAATEQHCKLNFELEVLHLKETVNELLATAEVMATVNQSSSKRSSTIDANCRPRLTKTQSVDPANVRALSTGITKSLPPAARRAQFILNKAQSQFNCKDNLALPESAFQRSKSNADPSGKVEDKVPLSIFQYRLVELENELSNSRTEMARLEVQLLEAVKQKMQLAEQIDDWQTDMEAVIVERVVGQASRDTGRQRRQTPEPSSRPQSPKPRRLSLANLLTPSRGGTPSPSKRHNSATLGRKQPLRIAPALEGDGTFKNTDFWTLSGERRKTLPETQAKPSKSRHSSLNAPEGPGEMVRRARMSLERPSSFVDPLSPLPSSTITTRVKKNNGLSILNWVK